MFDLCLVLNLLCCGFQIVAQGCGKREAVPDRPQSKEVWGAPCPIGPVLLGLSYWARGGCESCHLCLDPPLSYSAFHNQHRTPNIVSRLGYLGQCRAKQEKKNGPSREFFCLLNTGEQIGADVWGHM